MEGSVSRKIKETGRRSGPQRGALLQQERRETRGAAPSSVDIVPLRIEEGNPEGLPSCGKRPIGQPSVTPLCAPSSRLSNRAAHSPSTVILRLSSLRSTASATALATASGSAPLAPASASTAAVSAATSARSCLM